jgi:hypothetical protein
LKTGVWTVLWVATAPKNENQQVRSKSGAATRRFVGTTTHWTATRAK